MSKFGSYNASQAGLNAAKNLAAGCKSSGAHTAKFIDEMPSPLKKATLIIGAACFIITMVLTIVSLAPDAEDIERAEMLNQQFSALKAHEEI